MVDIKAMLGSYPDENGVTSGAQPWNPLEKWPGVEGSRSDASCSFQALQDSRRLVAGGALSRGPTTAAF